MLCTATRNRDILFLQSCRRKFMNCGRIKNDLENVKRTERLYDGINYNFDENWKSGHGRCDRQKETAREAVAEGKILVNRDVFSGCESRDSR